ncbi:MAG: hypothetical protein DSY46_03525 [Hydrogenimonas sp.]|nr:MAG: hypothetical protein DSY46_03525 [Hydrogenimonas sp.]
MEEKHDDFENLIMQSNRPSGLKKLLLTAATLLLLLILMILITKSMVQSDVKQSPSIILPPEPITASQKPSSEPSFEQVPIEEEHGHKKIEEVINRLKEKASTTKEPQNDAVVMRVEHEKPVVQPTPPKPSKVEPKAEPKRAPKVAPKREIKREVAPSHLPAPKEEVIASKAPKKHATTPKGFYIQVGAFFQAPPSQKFLNSITSQGLHYVTLHMEKNGTPYQKVLVGPYSSKSDALHDLVRVKKTINPHAYITEKR